MRTKSLGLTTSTATWNFESITNKHDVEPNSRPRKQQSWMAKSMMDWCPRGFSRTLHETKKLARFMDTKSSKNAAGQSQSHTFMMQNEVLHIGAASDGATTAVAEQLKLSQTCKHLSALAILWSIKDQKDLHGSWWIIFVSSQHN